MSAFFEAPSPPPEPPRPAPMPPWFSAPSGTVPGVVALELVIARNERVAVCVTRLGAYPSGFELDLVTMAGGEGDELDPLLFGGSRMHARLRTGESGIPPEMLRFGVEFADGAKATNTSGRFRDFHDEPNGPVLNTGGGGGGGGNWRQSLWVWPLPPPGRLTFVCEWPAAGIALTRHEIDAQLVLDAATRAEVIFADECLPRESTHVSASQVLRADSQ